MAAANTIPLSKADEEAARVAALLAQEERLEQEERLNNEGLRQDKQRLAKMRVTRVVKAYHPETPPDYVIFGSNPKMKVTLQDLHDLLGIE